MKLLLTLLILAIAQPSLHAQQITCTHVQVCNLIDDQLAQADGVKTKQSDLPLTTSGDPHHFEPSSAQIRSLLTSPYLISAPLALHPWMAPVLEKRAQNPELKTYSLEPDPKFLELYPGAKIESLSHFWLYPEISCQMQSQVASQLKKWGLSAREYTLCPNSYVEFTQNKAFKALQGATIVLTHDALAPKLKENKINVITLRGSHHGERLSSATLKSLHRELAKRQKVIWLFEEPLENSDQIMALVRPSDTQVKANTLGELFEKPFETYLRVLKELNKAGASK